MITIATMSANRKARTSVNESFLSIAKRHCLNLIRNTAAEIDCRRLEVAEAGSNNTLEAQHSNSRFVLKLVYAHVDMLKLYVSPLQRLCDVLRLVHIDTNFASLLIVPAAALEGHRLKIVNKSIFLVCFEPFFCLILYLYSPVST